VAGVASRFIAEMRLDEREGVQESPRERLRRLREQLTEPVAAAGTDPSR
jgi:hypothetical protein